MSIRNNKKGYTSTVVLLGIYVINTIDIEKELEKKLTLVSK